MLLAAAEPLGDAALVLRAGRRLGLEMGALAPAEAAELLEIGESVRFRHPLVRSAVYYTSSPAERAEAHRLLASAATDPLSRASHLAAAARQPDEAVAAELGEAAAAAAGGVRSHRRRAYLSARPNFRPMLTVGPGALSPQRRPTCTPETQMRRREWPRRRSRAPERSRTGPRSPP
jgi:hypothetical protein